MPRAARTRRWGIEASEHVAVLRDGAKTYWIVGTAHVSGESVREVREVIETVRPDTVCIELCQTRYDSLTDESRWKKLDIFQVLRQGKGLLLLANLAMGAYQRKLGAELGVEPGAELLEGARAAADVGAELRLVDREIQTTLRRTWANVGFFKKAELVGAILTATVSNEKIDATAIEDLKARAQLSEMLAEFARILPEVKAPLIDERDQYMMSGIEEAPGERVVAVVGAAHVPGMRAAFGAKVDRAPLDELPAPSRWGKVLKWLIPGLVLAAFAIGASRQGGQTLEAMLYAWILPNSIVCAVLTALAGAKPLSVVTGFIASPITSLNPMLGAGMVVGLVEAWQRRPTVEDAEHINRDVQSLRGFYKNPFTRVLLVTFASTLGSAMGAWIGATWVVTLLS
jgi:pheromone shutdown-related protein TraB